MSEDIDCYDEKIAKLFKIASDKGYPLASLLYGYMLSLIKIDKSEPSKYIRIGIRSRDPEALYNAATILIGSDEIREKDKVLAVNYLAFSASAGYVKAMSLLGAIFIDGRDECDALSSIFLQMAIKKGDVDAMFYYACILLDPRRNIFDMEKGLSLCMEAISKGNSDSMHHYAHLLHTGILFDVNEEEAIKYYKMAINKGNTDAMVDYADIISDFNPTESEKYYKLAIKKKI